MSKPLVLITGATGHIGFRVFAQTLAAGYRARVTSRNASSLSHLLSLPSIAPYASSVETLEVKDTLAPDAFDAAVQDCTYIIHVASPIPNATVSGSNGTHDPERDFVEPAIRSTINILESAAKTQTVKRIVITSSVGILAPTSPDATSVGPDDMRPVPDAESQKASHWYAYTASKILAHQRANEWVAAHRPRFDVLWVLPGYVMGANEPLTSTAGFLDRGSSNNTMILYALGKDSPNNEPRSLDLVLVDDVAETHVKLLEAKNVENGERFVSQYPGVVKGYGDIDEYVKKWFPEAVEKGLLPLGGKVDGMRVGFDSQKTTEKLGIKFKGVEEMVKSLIGQYVAVAKKEGKLA
jgi:nucleoside-diphosphate-sugar epimerase